MDRPPLNHDGFRAPLWYRLLGAGIRPLARRIAPGRCGLWKPSGTRPVWIHAASLGELKGALRLVHSLPAGLPAYLTSTTATGLEKLRREAPGIPSSLLPLDDERTVRQFLSTLDPRCAIFLESEAWPVTLQALAAQGIPTAFAAFRSGTASRRRWRRFGLLFPGWTHNAAAVWTDSPDQTEAVRSLGFAAVHPGTSLKWAGQIPSPADPSACRAAALSLHLRDLPEVGRLWRDHRDQGWLWFPRRPLQLRLWQGFARALGAKIADIPEPGPGEIWIAPRLGLVRDLLPSCACAWVSPGHDTEEPFHFGVARVLTGSPAVEVASPSRLGDQILHDIAAWIPPD